MRLNKKVKITLIVIPIIILVALMGFALANNNTNNSKSDTIVTRDRTSVILEQQKDNPRKIDVYLGMSDDSSIARFQIGLNVDIEEKYDAKFEWSTNLSDNTEAFKDVRINKEKTIETEGEVERINIYYVGTKELNQLTDKVNVDNIKIGTITIEGGDTTVEDDTPLVIRPLGTDGNASTTTDEDFTKTVSLSHVVSSVLVEEDDILRTDLSGKATQTPEPENPDPQDPDPQDPDPQDPKPEDPNPEDSDPKDPNPENPNPENPDPENPKPENPGQTNPEQNGSGSGDQDLNDKGELDETPKTGM